MGHSRVYRCSARRLMSFAHQIMCVGLIGLSAISQARAGVKEYEVLRFLYLKTACGRATITSEVRMHEHVRFSADCQNRTAFPDGAVVVCVIGDDDRSCRLETEAKDFDQLRLMKPDAESEP